MAEETLRSGDMADALEKGHKATCISGPFEGMQATKTDEGYVVLDDGTPYDFWDTRFAYCAWVFD